MISGLKSPVHQESHKESQRPRQNRIKFEKWKLSNLGLSNKRATPKNTAGYWHCQKNKEEALSTKRDFQDHNSIDESSNTDIWVKIIEAGKNEMNNLNKADH